MTSDVAYVIHTIITLIMTQGLCTITFFLCLSLFTHMGPFFLWSLPFLPFSHIHVVLLTLYRIRNQVYLSTRNCSRLNTIDGFLKRPQDLIADLCGHSRLNPDVITLQWGVNTQVSSDDPMGIICKNTANDLRKIWRRLSLNNYCWNWKSLHSFCNRERLQMSDRVCFQKAAQESLRLYDFVVIASQLLHMGATLGALQAS